MLENPDKRIKRAFYSLNSAPAVIEALGGMAQFLEISLNNLKRPDIDDLMSGAL